MRVFLRLGLARRTALIRPNQCQYHRIASSTLSTCSKCSPPRQPTPDEKNFWTDASTWQRAASNTTRCLVGCSLGDLTALSLLQGYTDLGIAFTVPLSCAAGVATSMALETVVLRNTEHLSWRVAFRTAAGMSLISMVSMELAENAVELALTGGAVSCTSTTFWQALPLALAAGFATPLPYNYFMLRRYGRGCH